MPDNLPDVRTASQGSSRNTSNPIYTNSQIHGYNSRVLLGSDMDSLAKFAGQPQKIDANRKEREDDAKNASAPVGTLMFREVERRIDVFVFRCCFAESIYEARRLVVHGSVKLNGVKVCIFSF